MTTERKLSPETKFIAEQTGSTTSEIIRAAEAAGLNIDAAKIHNVRSWIRQKEMKPARKQSRAERDDRDDLQELKRIIARLGINAVHRVLYQFDRWAMAQDEEDEPLTDPPEDSETDGVNTPTTTEHN